MDEIVSDKFYGLTKKKIQEIVSYDFIDKTKYVELYKKLTKDNSEEYYKLVSSMFNEESRKESIRFNNSMYKFASYIIFFSSLYLAICHIFKYLQSKYFLQERTYVMLELSIVIAIFTLLIGFCGIISWN